MDAGAVTTPARLFAGIGPRNLDPGEPWFKVEEFAGRLFSDGWHLRTGAAPGADSAFMLGFGWKHWMSGLSVFLPWKDFNNFSERPPMWNENDVHVVGDSSILREKAAESHPAWSRLSSGARKLIARNVAIILGEDLKSPVKFVATHTTEGWTGGTGFTLRLAQEAGIPIIDLAEMPVSNAYAEVKILGEIRER